MVDIYDNTAITGHFNFDPSSSINNTIAKGTHNDWKICHKTCTHCNILPPTPRSQNPHQPSIQKLSKTRKMKSSAN